MKPVKIRGPLRRVKGEIRTPSDKSISHRSLILGSIAEGVTRVRNILRSADTLATLEILRSIGTEIVEEDGEVIIKGRGYRFKEPSDVLNAKNSGTTARLMMGVLSTQPFFSVITGDESLRSRPMGRVVIPLREMGAEIMGRNLGENLPVAINGRRLRAISHTNRRSSAQVKSALLLAGLGAEGITEVFEPILSRDHTERMLRAFGGKVVVISEEEGHLIKVAGGQVLRGTEVICPADPSSSAFFAALAVLTDGELLLRDVLVNPTRDGFFRKLIDMGADVSYLDEREVAGEPIADVRIKGGKELNGIKVGGNEIPSMIDEIPILAVVMSLARGRSVVRGAKELRFKESDRIKAVCQHLRKMGANIEELDDGFVVEGVSSLKGTEISTGGDHRIAMAFTVAGLVAEGETIIDDPDCVSISYPGFYKDLFSLIENS